MRKIILILILLCDIYGGIFQFEEIKKIILNETKGEKVYINNLTNISTKTSKYISVEFANASIFKYYILIIQREKNISITKYNFNPNGAYSFAVEYQEVEQGIKNFFKKFIEESSLNITYIENKKIQFSPKNTLIQIALKRRVPSSTIFINKNKVDNHFYVEPVFNREYKLKYFYIYPNNIKEEDIMSQNYSKLINKKELHINLQKNQFILSTKQPLYKSPSIKTKMYLIKGDQVEVLEEKDNWLHILYHGKKDIKAWIPKSAVEE
jgi:hypothetical protein